MFKNYAFDNVLVGLNSGKLVGIKIHQYNLKRTAWYQVMTEKQKG